MFEFIPLDNKPSKDVEKYLKLQEDLQIKISKTLGIPREIIYRKSKKESKKESKIKIFFKKLWKKITFQKH